jgi:hypothetical protein
VVHLDIAFGDCMSVGGFKYALMFVDRATRTNWCFGLKSLHLNNILSAFLTFQSEAGRLANTFDVTVMTNFLVATFAPSSILRNPLSLPAPWDGNLPMALLNLTRRLWFTCHAPI